MTEAGRRVRMGAVAVVLALLLLGSWRGSDHDFPFGPFRMFATPGRPTGAVRTALLIGVRGDRQDYIDPEAIGIRRAELEGQYARFAADPALLEDLAHALDHQGRVYDTLRLVRQVQRIEARRRVGRPTIEGVAEWRRR